MDFTLDSAHGGNPFAEAWSYGAGLVASNSSLVLGVLIVLVVMIIYFSWWRLCSCAAVQAFMPTQTMWAQSQDQVGTGSTYERATGAPAAPAMAAAGAAPSMPSQSGLGSAVQGTLTGGVGSGSQPGTLSYQVLNSPDFACATRVPTTDNAWQWMSGVMSSSPVAAPTSAVESYRHIREGASGRPASSNDLSRILAGQ